jgi:hypothetical protein
MIFIILFRQVTWRETLLPLLGLLALALAVSGCTPPTVGSGPGDINLPVVTDKPMTLKQLAVEPDCQVQLPRESLIDVLWIDPATGRQPQRIDLTSYKRGFSQGLYYSMIAGKDQGFKVPQGQNASANLDASMKQMRNRDFQFDAKGGSTRLALGGLVPGMTYFLRVCRFDATNKQWIPSQTIRFDAPVCRNDQVDEK